MNVVIINGVEYAPIVKKAQAVPSLITGQPIYVRDNEGELSCLATFLHYDDGKFYTEESSNLRKNWWLQCKAVPLNVHFIDIKDCNRNHKGRANVLLGNGLIIAVEHFEDYSISTHIYAEKPVGFRMV